MQTAKQITKISIRQIIHHGGSGRVTVRNGSESWIRDRHNSEGVPFDRGRQKLEAGRVRFGGWPEFGGWGARFSISIVVKTSILEGLREARAEFREQGRTDQRAVERSGLAFVERHNAARARDVRDAALQQLAAATAADAADD